MKAIFSSYAKLELDDAVYFYELEYKGLGLRFKNEVKQAIERILKYPSAWSIEQGEIRKYLLHQFPYKLLYSIVLQGSFSRIKQKITKSDSHPGRCPQTTGC